MSKYSGCIAVFFFCVAFWGVLGSVFYVTQNFGLAVISSAGVMAAFGCVFYSVINRKARDDK